MPRRRRQRKRQKSNWLNKQNNNVTLFLCISLPSQQDYDGNMPNFTWGDVNKRQLNFLPLSEFEYRIYSINRPGRLLNFWTLRVGAYSRWALIRGWAVIKFSPFSASEVCLFCNKTINANNKTRRSNKARFL